MKSVWSVLKLALPRGGLANDARAAAGRPAEPAVCASSWPRSALAFQFLAAGPGGGFNPYGLNALVAWIALEVAVAALFVQPVARPTALSAMLTLSSSPN